MAYFDYDIGCLMPDSPEDFMSYDEYQWLEFMDGNPGEWLNCEYCGGYGHIREFMHFEVIHEGRECSDCKGTGLGFGEVEHG
jgi:DnaJ-class molecular chaperone